MGLPNALQPPEPGDGGGGWPMVQWPFRLLGSMLRPPRHRRWPHRGRTLLLANPPRHFRARADGADLQVAGAASGVSRERSFSFSSRRTSSSDTSVSLGRGRSRRRTQAMIMFGSSYMASPTWLYFPGAIFVLNDK